MPHPIPRPGRKTCVRPSGPEHCHHLQVEVVCCLPLEPEERNSTSLRSSGSRPFRGCLGQKARGKEEDSRTAGVILCISHKPRKIEQFGQHEAHKQGATQGPTHTPSHTRNLPKRVVLRKACRLKATANCEEAEGAW